MMSVDFGEEPIQLKTPRKGKSPIINFLIKKGIAEDEQKASMILLVASIVFIALSIIIVNLEI